jgi:hypothetical protein
VLINTLGSPKTQTHFFSLGYVPIQLLEITEEKILLPFSEKALFFFCENALFKASFQANQTGRSSAARIGAHLAFFCFETGHS